MDYKKIRDLAGKVAHYEELLVGFEAFKSIGSMEIYGIDKADKSYKVTLKKDVLNFDISVAIAGSVRNKIEHFKQQLENEISEH